MSDASRGAHPSRRRAGPSANRMPKNDLEPARRPPEADELTVQFSVPKELLLELAAIDDERTRVAPLPDAFLEEQTLLMLPSVAAEAARGGMSRVTPSRSGPSPLRPMTAVSISDAEMSALLRPQRLARWVGVALVLVIALIAFGVALATH